MPNKDSLALAFIDNGSHLAYADWGYSWARSLLHPMVQEEMSGRRVGFIRLSYGINSGAMNHATASFLASPMDRLIVVDLDQEWEPHDFAYLLSHDVPLVAGMYQKKQVKHEWTLSFEGENRFSDDQAFVDANPLVEVDRISRGFINIHRSVFNLVAFKTPVLKDTQTGEPILDYWRPLPNGHSEDFAFCDRYRESGGKVYADQRIRIGHWGPQRFPILKSELESALSYYQKA